MDDAVTLIDGCKRGVFSKGYTFCCLRRQGWSVEEALKAVDEKESIDRLVNEYIEELEHMLMFKNIK